MNISKLKRLPWLLFLSLVVSAPSCVTVSIQDGAKCAAAGLVSSGGLCAHMIDTSTSAISMVELLDLLQAHPKERICVPKWGLPICAEDQSTGVPVKLPSRGASVILPPDVFGTLTQELNTLCRAAGKDCSYETQKFIEGMMR